MVNKEYKLYCILDLSRQFIFDTMVLCLRRQQVIEMLLSLEYLPGKCFHQSITGTIFNQTSHTLSFKIQPFYWHLRVERRWLGLIGHCGADGFWCMLRSNLKRDKINTIYRPCHHICDILVRHDTFKLILQPYGNGLYGSNRLSTPSGTFYLYKKIHIPFKIWL